MSKMCASFKCMCNICEQVQSFWASELWEGAVERRKWLLDWKSKCCLKILLKMQGFDC